jgi:hypothetical protein
MSEIEQILNEMRVILLLRMAVEIGVSKDLP